jgi:maltooligosyltrehalose trehalohydrolase
MLLAPHLPLLFMGEEYGEDRPFLFFCSFGDGRLIDDVRRGRRRDYGLQGEVPDPQDETAFLTSRLNWSWPEGTARAGLRRLYRDLLTARREWTALRDFVNRKARLLPDAANGPLLELVRGELRAFFNLSDRPQPLPQGGRVLFTSEASSYGGSRREDGNVSELLAYECVVFESSACLSVPG